VIERVRASEARASGTSAGPRCPRLSVSTPPPQGRGASLRQFVRRPFQVIVETTAGTHRPGAVAPRDRPLVAEERLIFSM